MVDSRPGITSEEIAERLMAIADELIVADANAHVPRVAAMFCAMNDDAQGRVFELVAKTMESWGPGKKDMQLCYIAEHMKECECVTDAGRELVASLAGFLVEPEELLIAAVDYQGAAASNLLDALGYVEEWLAKCPTADPERPLAVVREAIAKARAEGSGHD